MTMPLGRSNGNVSNKDLALIPRGHLLEDVLNLDYEIDTDGIPFNITGENVFTTELPSFFGPELKLPSGMQENLKLMKFENPTTIQKYGIPQILTGRDVMCVSHTGSGKTAVYLLPFLSKVYGEMETETIRSKSKSKSYPKMLVLVPTRELADQVVKDVKSFTSGLPYRVKSLSIYGGLGMDSQIRDLETGQVNLIAATPGRLLHLLTKDDILDLSELEWLVHDEADEMFNKDFYVDINKIIKTYTAPLGGSRINLMFSATFPRQIKYYAQKHLKRDHVFLAVGMVGGANPYIIQQIVPASQTEKSTKLDKILDEELGNKVIIFCNTIEKVKFLAANLALKYPDVCACIHSELTQAERFQTLDDFEKKKVTFLVATSVAARGLNLQDVYLVINFDFPTDISDYVQRIGRGRSIGSPLKARAISFFDQEDDEAITDHLIFVLGDAKQVVPEFLTSICESMKKLQDDILEDNPGADELTFLTFEKLYVSKGIMDVSCDDSGWWG